MRAASRAGMSTPRMGLGPARFAALTVIAEPGIYQLDASAVNTVHHANFQPAHHHRSRGADVRRYECVLRHARQHPGLCVTVSFPRCRAWALPRSSSHRWGPETPQASSPSAPTAPARKEPTASPLFYDIDTTAQFTEATVCVRRKFRRQRLSQFLRSVSASTRMPSCRGSGESRLRLLA